MNFVLIKFCCPAYCPRRRELDLLFAKFEMRLFDEEETRLSSPGPFLDFYRLDCPRPDFSVYLPLLGYDGYLLSTWAVYFSMMSSSL